jgi:hypothetical protein
MGKMPMPPPTTANSEIRPENLEANGLALLSLELPELSHFFLEPPAHDFGRCA